MEKNKNKPSLLSRVEGFLKSRRSNSPLHMSISMPEDSQGIREDIESRLSRAGQPLPTEDQWQMILTGCDTTRVVAGAGSGKSTTLVLRIIVMAFYRNIPLNAIRVVTFTRNSRADFMSKLRETVLLWEIDLSIDQARAIVRTFHSLVFAQAKAAGLNVNTLDQLDSTANSAGGASPFPALSIAADSELANTLNAAASHLIEDDPSFAEVIASLYNHSFLVAGGMHVDESKINRVLAVKHNDFERTKFMELIWRQSIAPELMESGLIEFKMDSFMTGAASVNGQVVEAHGPWWANAFIPKLNAWLLLGAANRYSRGKKTPDGFALGPAIGAKKSCVNVFVSDHNVIWVNSPDELAALHLRLKWAPSKDESFPKFGIKLTGEVVSTPLLVAFWQQAQFIQSLGLDVTDAAALAAEKTSGVDALFSKALALFWPAFTSLVQNRGFTLSNSIFQQLTDPALLARLPDSAIFGVQHLLIDEFQDISGVIVNWLNAVRSEIVSRGRKTTLMVVGDDWQSIYGWRGASPRYFTHFFDYFPESENNSTTIYLSDNFRSSQKIVDAAGVSLNFVKEKLEKQSRARGRYANLDNPVEFVLLNDDPNTDKEQIDEFINRDSVFVISRTRNALNAFRDGSARTMTIHGCKGLEADNVLIVDDFGPPGAHPVRCSWYSQAGLGDYDASQADETLRLAYVAITRAKKECRWVVKTTANSGTFMRLAEHGTDAIKLVEVACESN